MAAARERVLRAEEERDCNWVLEILGTETWRSEILGLEVGATEEMEIEGGEMSLEEAMMTLAMEGSGILRVWLLLCSID